MNSVSECFKQVVDKGFSIPTPLTVYESASNKANKRTAYRSPAVIAALKRLSTNLLPLKTILSGNSMLLRIVETREFAAVTVGIHT